MEGARRNPKNKKGGAAVSSSLWATVAAGRLRETELLLQQATEAGDHQRDLHRTDMEGDTILLLAVRSGNPDLVQLLVDHGSHPDVRNRKTGVGPLHEALLLFPRLRSGSSSVSYDVMDLLRILEVLVERGAYVGLRDKMGRTPLHIATEQAFEEAIEYLLSVGANPTLKDRQGRKPVHIARADQEHPHIYERFFNVDFKTRQERKPKGKGGKGGVRRKKDPNQRLFKAIQLGRLRELENLLAAGVKANIRVNGTSHRGHSPVYLASKLGNLEALKLLLKYGAKPYLMNTCGTTPLHAAAEGGHDAVVELLLANKVQIDVRDNDKKTPLDLAFQKGRTSTIHLLLDRLLGRGQTFSPKRWDWMFRKAAKNGQVDLMKLVLKGSKSLDINAQTLSGWAPLHVAVRHGQVGAVAFLLSRRGIKTNLGTDTNWTPLHVACSHSDRNKRLQMMSLLLAQKGTNPNIQNNVGFTPLHICAKKHDLEGIRVLLEYNANPNIKDAHGWAPLTIAFCEKQQKSRTSTENEESGLEDEDIDEEEEVMHCLIEGGADPNQLSFTSRTSPLFEAIRLGKEKRAEILIEYGADVNFVMPARKVARTVQPSDGVPKEDAHEETTQEWSVLAMAVLKQRSPHIISKLVEKGACVNFVNSKGYTPLHTAVTLCNHEVVRILLEGGADPNIENSSRHSPLHTAFCVAFADKADLHPAPGVSSESDSDRISSRRQIGEIMIRDLLDHGALVDTDLNSLLKTALYGNNPAVLSLLLRHTPTTETVGSLFSESNDLLTYLLAMRRRPGTKIKELKDLLSIFIDGRWDDFQQPSPSADGGKGNDFDQTNTANYRISVNAIGKSGRTAVHDLILSSVFAIVNASKADKEIPETLLRFEGELVQFLVSKGAHLNLPDTATGFTPLISSVLALGLVQGKPQTFKSRILKVIEMLFSLGALDDSIPDKMGRNCFHHAAYLGEIEQLLQISEAHLSGERVKAFVNSPDSKGRPPLFYSVKKGDLQVILTLIKYGACVNSRDYKGRTTIQLAITQGYDVAKQKQIIDALLSSGADVTLTTSRGLTVLDLAVRSGRWDLAECLAAKGAKFSRHAARKKSSKQKWPVLHSLAKSGNYETAKMLLTSGCKIDVNEMDRHMWTAVHIAVLNGDVQMTRLLLENGADPSQNTNHAWSVLHTAAALRRARTGEELVKEKLAKQAQDRRQKLKADRALGIRTMQEASEKKSKPKRLSPEELEAAKKQRKEEKAKQLEDEQKADVAAQSYEDLSANLLSLLFEFAADKLNINGTDERGRTALDVALLVGNLKAANILAAHGGRKRRFAYPDNRGWNDLHKAVFAGDQRGVRDILRILSDPSFSAFIDINAADEAMGVTPLLIAARKPNATIVKMLLEHGADPALADRSQRNALHLALMYKRRSVVKELLKYVNNEIIMARTKDGYTCLDLASPIRRGTKLSLLDLITKNYKKAVVEERPANILPEQREKKSKQGKERIVGFDVAAWGGRKTGNRVILDLHEDWEDWQADYDQENEDYEQEEEWLAQNQDDDQGYDDAGDEGVADVYGRHYRYPGGPRFIDWNEYIPASHIMGGLQIDQHGFLHDDGSDVIAEPAVWYEDQQPLPSGGALEEYPAEVQEVMPTFFEHGDQQAFAEEEPSRSVDEEAEDQSSWLRQEEEEAQASYYGFSWGAAPTNITPGYMPPTSCPFCGSLWDTAEAAAAHALAAHNAYLS